MLPADTYVSNHTSQIRDVGTVLKQFKPLLKCISKQKVIDIGCGPGDITYDFLVPMVRPSAELHGIDISENMIDVAKTNYADSRVNFQAMDLIGHELISTYDSYFDSVYSFFCLHWVHDQRKAMENIYSILKPGGETLLIFAIDFLTYTLYESLAANQKWAPYFTNYKDYVSPFRNSVDPASDVRNLMEDVGFRVKECEPSLKSFTFASEELFFGWASALDPLRKGIPKSLLEEYDEERKNFWKNENSYTLNETNGVTTNYKVITVFAHKPETAEIPVIPEDDAKNC